MNKEMSLKETETKEEVQFSEMNYDTIEAGPLYVDPKFKKAGFVYEFVADEGGQIQNKLKIGYMIIQDDITVGDNVASKTTKFGSAVTVQSRCGRVLVLMATSKENHDKYMAYRDKKQAERQASLRRAKIDNVDESLQDFSHDPSNVVGYRETKK